MIDVTCIGSGDPLEFDVVIDDGAGRTQHRITMSRKTYGRVSEGGQTPENCVEATFLFLLDREPKEAILEQFDIILVSRYFPEFEKELPEYMRRAKKKIPFEGLVGKFRSWCEVRHCHVKRCRTWPAAFLYQRD